MVTNMGLNGVSNMKRRIKKPEAPRIWLRVNHEHVAKVLEARRRKLLQEVEVRYG